MRNIQTRLGKAYTEALLKQRQAQGFSSGNNNPGNTNASVNAIAKIFRVGGRILIVVAIANQARTIMTAESPIEELPRSGGRLGGGFAGGSLGATVGARFGIVGVVGGSLAGGVFGSYIGEKAIDAFFLELSEIEARHQEIYFYGHPGGARP